MSSVFHVTVPELSCYTELHLIIVVMNYTAQLIELWPTKMLSHLAQTEYIDQLYDKTNLVLANENV